MLNPTVSTRDYKKKQVMGWGGVGGRGRGGKTRRLVENAAEGRFSHDLSGKVNVTSMITKKGKKKKNVPTYEYIYVCIRHEDPRYPLAPFRSIHVFIQETPIKARQADST